MRIGRRGMYSAGPVVDAVRGIPDAGVPKHGEGLRTPTDAAGAMCAETETGKCKAAFRYYFSNPAWASVNNISMEAVVPRCPLKRWKPVSRCANTDGTERRRLGGAMSQVFRNKTRCQNCLCNPQDVNLPEKYLWIFRVTQPRAV